MSERISITTNLFHIDIGTSSSAKRDKDIGNNYTVYQYNVNITDDAATLQGGVVVSIAPEATAVHQADPPPPPETTSVPTKAMPGPQTSPPVPSTNVSAIMPPIPPKLCKIIFAAYIQKSQKEWPTDTVVIYDGSYLLYSNCNIINPNSNEKDSQGREYMEQAVSEKDFNPGKPIKTCRSFNVRIALTRVDDISTLANTIQGPSLETLSISAESSNKQDIESLIQLISIASINTAPTTTLDNENISSSTSSNSLVQIKNSIYDTSRPVSEHDGVAIVTGFFVAPLVGQEHMFMNIYTSTMPFYSEGNLLEVIKGEFFRNRPVEEFGRYLIRDRAGSSNYRDKIERYLKGVKVMVGHQAHEQKTIKVKSLTDESADNYKFPMRRSTAESRSKGTHEEGSDEDTNMVMTSITGVLWR